MPDPDELAQLGPVVRHALAARTSDPHLIDDLTQETLLRVARAEHRLTGQEQRAYAVVTARNLLFSHFRSQSVQRRHQHRLLEHGGPTDPEQRTIDNEETAALASALTRLDPDERDLLLRHEVTGTDLATLAGESDVSRGAIAMRLARARANLRLEFLLVFRRLSLPTPRCRSVLLSLAAADHRRQAQLDAVGHLETCPTCAELLPPMTDRDRRVAAWLFAPVSGLLGRIRRSFRSWWVLAVPMAGLLALAGGIIVLVDDPKGAAEVTSGAPAAPNPVAAPATAPPATAPTTSANAAPPAPAPPATTLVVAPATAPPSTEPTSPATPPSSADAQQPVAPACPPPAPLTALDLPAAIGCPFGVSAVTVLTVPSSTELVATAGPWSVTISVANGAALPLAVIPGVRISIAGTVDGISGGQQLAVTVDAGEIRLAG